ncbi:SEN54 endonuclease, partial [Acromyrmex charruanus]
MDEPPEKLPCNTLTAKELLCNKGISTCLLEEWERSLKTLPKSGKKHFEPDNSWLQNIQIEKGLKKRKDLLNVERVERISELASAEWLPSQKRALVTKRSGQDWSNFGLERNGSLYLLPEEALFLIETNCLELIWNGLSCSIQQAYEILIDDSVCTLEEYRVYSQLTRYGYRIQRYFYEESDKCNRSDELTLVKRKIIVDPENGLRMSDNQPQNKQNVKKSKLTLTNNMPETSDKSVNLNVEKHEKTTVQEFVKQVISDLVDQVVCNIVKRHENEPATFREVENNVTEKTANSEEKNRHSKPEIISDETLLGNIKILRDTSCKVSWPGARIQRNVKQLPKRNDKVSFPEISIIDSDTSENSRYPEKRKAVSQIDELHMKKSKHEVIELSDDEVQELPRCMTRMEMLNLLPNIAFQSEINEKISRRYIPHNIRPQKSTYQYNRTMILNMQENDKRARQNCKNDRTNARQNTSHSRSPLAVNNRNASFQNQRSLLRSPSRSFYSVDQMHGTHISLPYTYRFPFNYFPDVYLQNRVTQNVFHNLFVAFGNHGNTVQQRSYTIQMNNFMIPIIEGYRTRHFFTENQLRHNFYQNTLWQQRFCQRRMIENASMHGSTHSVARRRHDDTNNLAGYEIINRPSFTTRLGTSSWTELKKRWFEEKTITIDDEDCKNLNESEEDCTEVQVVKFLNPLVSPRNVSSMTEIFSKLAIIKSAPERTVRRKKSKYKISYNVYSCTHHYKKANPGQPLYSLVVIRKEDSILQPVELNRLQQDAKGSQIVLAYVSMSISYIQPGIITMPNII